MRDLAKPAIAAIHGHCPGAGLELAPQCDLRLDSMAAWMGVPAVKLGLPYRLEESVKLIDVIGLARAREMMLLGRSYADEDLLAMGLLHHLLPGQAAMEAAAGAMAAELAANAPLAWPRPRWLSTSLRDGTVRRIWTAQRFADDCHVCRDHAEGRAVRREKRPPRFEGR